MQNIFLIGFMGTGKSTVASMFRNRKQLQLIEMDQKIEKQEGMTISEIFEKYGEEYFRELETKLLKKIQQRDNQIVSCGGGVVLRDENVKIMRQNGVIVLLCAQPATILERVKRGKNRPLLNGHMEESYIAELMEKRHAKYRSAADIVVHTDGKNKVEICNEIIEKLKNRRE